MPRTRFLLAGLLLPLTSLIASPAFCQATKPTSPTVCLSVPQAAKIADSLRVLPLVRLEASQWKAATDSLRTVSTDRLRACRALSAALQDERLVRANETAKVDTWRHRARKRGLLNYLLAAVAGGSLYLLVKP